MSCYPITCVYLYLCPVRYYHCRLPPSTLQAIYSYIRATHGRDVHLWEGLVFNGHCSSQIVICFLYQRFKNYYHTCSDNQYLSYRLKFSTVNVVIHGHCFRILVSTLDLFYQKRTVDCVPQAIPMYGRR